MNYHKCEPNLVKFMGIFPKPWCLASSVRSCYYLLACIVCLVYLWYWWHICCYRMGVLKCECCDWVLLDLYWLSDLWWEEFDFCVVKWSQRKTTLETCWETVQHFIFCPCLQRNHVCTWWIRCGPFSAMWKMRTFTKFLALVPLFWWLTHCLVII